MISLLLPAMLFKKKKLKLEREGEGKERKGEKACFPVLLRDLI